MSAKEALVDSVRHLICDVISVCTWSCDG